MPYIPRPAELQLELFESFQNRERGGGLARTIGPGTVTREKCTLDDQRRYEKIFKLNLDGDLKKRKSFRIPDQGLEGITLDPSGEFLLTIKEDNNEIIEVTIRRQSRGR